MLSRTNFRFPIRYGFLLISFVSCFLGGYCIGVKQERQYKANELARLLNTIHGDTWRSFGGTSTSTMVPYPSNTTVCTVEDIFGSREAFQNMLSVDGDPFSSTVDPFSTEPPANLNPFESGDDTTMNRTW